MPNSKISRTTPETQDDLHWTAPSGVLGELVEQARFRAVSLSASRDLDAIGESRRETLKLSTALRRPAVAVIAEIKRSSPSRGIINVGIDSADQARRYESGGAAAVSVLTEPSRFGGSDDDIVQVSEAVKLPILKKDFHVTEAQIAHAAMSRASAALIIVRAVSPAELVHLSNAAKRARLELVYEVRDENELDRAINSGARIIGVNNRNLETLDIDRDTVTRIIPLIPRECIAIAESGYSTQLEIEEAASAGADAVLVGSSLSASPDPEASVRALSSIARRPR